MCLSELKEFPKSTNLKKGIGYKAFEKDMNGKLVTPFECYRVQINKWMKDTCPSYLSFVNNFDTYKTGFHICLQRKDARGWGSIVKKVKFKNVTMTGTQGGEPIVVAREMLILPGSQQ